MKKFAKLFSFVIVFIVSIGILLNQDVITAFAKELLIEDVEYNQVYDYGDKIGIFDDLGDPIQDVWVGYLDKESNLMNFYLMGSGLMVNHKFSSGIYGYYTYLNYFYLGNTCEEVVDDFLAYENVDDYLAEPEYYDSYLTFVAERKRYFCEESGFNLYYEKSEDLKNVKRWKLLDNGDKTLEYYCSLYDFDVCKDDYDYLLTYRGDYYYEIPVMMFQEYVEPKFEFKCDSDKVEYGKCLSCNLNIDSEEEITQIKTNIKAEQFDIKDFTAKNGWTHEIDSDGYYVLKNDVGFTGNEVALSLQLEPKKNIDSDSVVNLESFEYTTSGGFTEKVELKTDLKVNAIVNNPNTVDKILIVLLVSIIGMLGLVVVLVKPNNRFE